MKYDILIIVQAAADLKHALSIYKKYKGKKIHLCIVNVKSIYDFVNELDLQKTNISFQPYVQLNVRNPFSYFIAKNKLSNIWKTYFKANIYKKVYFFSRFYDWFSASLIGFFLRETDVEIFYYDHYDDASVKNSVVLRKRSIEFIKYKFITFVISYISKVKFISKYKFKPLEFNYLKYPISKISPEQIVEVQKEFQYKIKVNSTNNILFFLSPEEIMMLTGNSKEIIINALLHLKKRGYNLYLKGHPRLGLPNELIKYFDNIIPTQIPSEFVSYNNIYLTVGIISAALSLPALLDYKVISLINVLEFLDEDRKINNTNYLTELGCNKIEFVTKNWLQDL